MFDPEDYYEVMELLPQNIQDLMMKIQQSNAVEENKREFIEQRQMEFLQKCKEGKLKGEALKREYAKLSKISEAALAAATEREQMAAEAQELVSTCFEELELKIENMKMSLETKKPNVVECIQRRKLPEDAAESSEQADRKNSSSQTSSRMPNKGIEIKKVGIKTQSTETASVKSSTSVVTGSSAPKCKRQATFDLDNSQSTSAQARARSKYVTRSRNVMSGSKIRNQRKQNLNLPDETPDELEKFLDKIYCICNKESYGNMIGCDNKACPYEWFHYECVDIVVVPKGEWYCPECRIALRRRKYKNLDRSYKGKF